MANLSQVAVAPTDAGNPAYKVAPGATLTGADLEHVVFWGSGAAVLLIITDFYPRLGLTLTGLIVAGVLLRFSTQVTGWLQSATTASTSHASTSGQVNAGGINQSGAGPASRVVALPGNAFLRGAIRSQTGSQRGA